MFKEFIFSFDRLFFKPSDTAMCAVVRIGFGLILLPYVFILGLDLEAFHGESGVLPFGVSRMLVDDDVLSPLGWIAANDTSLIFCYLFFLFQALCLLIGFGSRFQALGVFFWLIAFQHRNSLLIDGGDILAHMIAFYLFCMPCGERFSMDAWMRGRRGKVPRELPIWGLRLLQVQMFLLYLSTSLLKYSGVAWRDGSAMVYIVQLNDVWGRFPLPEALFGSVFFLKILTLTVLVLELLIPFGLVVKSTRMFTVCTAMCFHLAIDYSMNLFLFQWIMIVGLLSYVDLDFLPLRWIRSWFGAGKEVPA